MLPGIVALAILLTIFAISELIAQETKAVLSTVLSVAIILLLGFWTGILPKSIFEDAGLSNFGLLVAGMLITSLGTTLDFQELKTQWKVVVISLLGVVGSSALILLGGQLFGLKAYAITGAPIFAGGNAATLIMTEALKGHGMDAVITYCMALLILQKFIGIPIASMLLKKEAQIFRQDAKNLELYSKVKEKTVSAGAKKGLLSLPDKLQRPSVYLAKLALVAALSHYIALAMNGLLHYFVVCLIMGVLAFSLGFLEKGILQKTQSSVLINFLVTIVIFSNLSATTPQQVLQVLAPLATFMVLGVGGIFIIGYLAGKVFKLSPLLSIALGISCTFGFPTTMFLPQEVSVAVGQTKEEVQAIENYLLPKMLVAGLVTVTISSVILAGIAVHYLF
ncbi:hypothetical protein ACVR05_10375 [Streptococcus caprae]|uniref:Na+/glutamate symporter n=1 Tax=Streptococcus caprae TaxID=1640501 RepID=A0ABV8CVG1_9STRE